MNHRLKRSVIILRWTLGLVVLFESCLLAFEPGTIRAFEHAGFPKLVRPMLAWSEIIAASLYLVPTSEVAGSYLLLIVFALAAVVHILHGQYEVGGLVVYGMVVGVTLAWRERKQEVLNE